MSAMRRTAWVWLQWYGRGMMVVVACLLAGVTVLLAAAKVGLEPRDVDDGTYAGIVAAQNLLLPFTATAYFLLLGLLGWIGWRPRVWAFLLLPVFWSYIPYLALFPWFPPTGVMWLSLLGFAGVVELSPYRGQRTDLSSVGEGDGAPGARLPEMPPDSDATRPDLPLITPERPTRHRP